jgi:hypothetical protein
MAKRMLNFGEGARDGSGRGERLCGGDVPGGINPTPKDVALSCR